MRVIPVIDLLRGQVVRGVGGRRDEYRPIVSQLVESSDPAAVAAALKARFDPQQIYVADLDAISGGQRDANSWRVIAATGVALLLDAGLQTASDAEQLWQLLQQEFNNAKLVIGLESLRNLQELTELQRRLGSAMQEIVVSLDMRAGKLQTPDADWLGATPQELIAEVWRCGIPSLIVLDLADVGSGQGTSTLPLLRELRSQFPDMELIAGGGVRGAADLRDMQQAGASAALVASALHDGRLTAEDCRGV